MHYILISNKQGFPPKSLLALRISNFQYLANLIDIKYLIVLICFTLITNDLENLFIFPLAFWILSSMTRILCIFVHRVLVESIKSSSGKYYFMLIGLQKSLAFSTNNCWLVLEIANIFPQCVLSL